MSISLPGLARFGCDLSATVGGIPNFGQESSSRKLASKRGQEGASQALSTSQFMGGSSAFYFTRMSSIHQLIRQLSRHPWPRSLPAAVADRAFVGAWNSRAANPKSLAVAISLRTAISNAFLCGGLATVGTRQKNSGFAGTDGQRNFTSWALWAADVAASALPGLRRCRQ